MTRATSHAAPLATPLATARADDFFFSAFMAAGAGYVLGS
jgi:hypothetical protein